MRLRLPTGTIALVTLAALGPFGAAHADETFVCGDGRMLTLTSENREALRNHPCVKDWFDKEAARRVTIAVLTSAPPRNATSPVRFPVSRALALRKVEGRATQLAAVRVATAAVQQSYLAPGTTPRVRAARAPVILQQTAGKPQAAGKSRLRIRLRRR